MCAPGHETTLRPLSLLIACVNPVTVTRRQANVHVSHDDYHHPKKVIQCSKKDVGVSPHCCHFN